MTSEWTQQGYGQRTQQPSGFSLREMNGRDEFEREHGLQAHRFEGAPARVALGVGLAGLGLGIAQLLRTRSRRAGIPVESFVLVNRSPRECYRFWRDFANLPRFMKHLQSVHVIDERRSLFCARDSGATHGEWVSELVEDIPNRYLAWRSLPGSNIDHSGSVRFEPATGGRGTIVRVQMRYRPTAKQPRAFAAQLFNGSREATLREDLRRFKQLVESGEIPAMLKPSGRRRAFAGRTRGFAGLTSSTLS